MMPGCRAHLLCTCRILRPPRKAGLPRWCRPICSLRMWVLGHDPHAHSRYITPGTHTSQRPIMDNGKWDCYCRPASLSSWQWCDECEALWCMTCWASACTCEMEVERRARACTVPRWGARLLCAWCRILRPKRKALDPLDPPPSSVAAVSQHPPVTASGGRSPTPRGVGQRPVDGSGKFDCYCQPASLSFWHWCDDCAALWCLTCGASACHCEMEIEQQDTDLARPRSTPSQTRPVWFSALTLTLALAVIAGAGAQDPDPPGYAAMEQIVQLSQRLQAQHGRHGAVRSLGPPISLFALPLGLGQPGEASAAAFAGQPDPPWRHGHRDRLGVQWIHGARYLDWPFDWQSHDWPSTPYHLGHEAQLQAFIAQDRLVRFALWSEQADPYYSLLLSYWSYYSDFLVGLRQ